MSAIAGPTARGAATPFPQVSAELTRASAAGGEHGVAAGTALLAA